MAETWILDDDAISESRTEFNITPYIAPPGPDLGTAEIEPYFSSAVSGQVPVDYRVPNRHVQIPLILHGKTGLSFDQLRDRIQQKVGLFQKEGGWVSRTVATGTVYADVVSASLKFGGSDHQALGHADPDAVLTLECIPDWYGDEVSASPAHTETTLPELIWTETGIEGNYPLGNRCRFVFTELSGQIQYAILWAFRSRYYSSDADAALAYEAESRLTGGGASAALTGASGGNVWQRSSVGTSWVEVGSSTFEHVGTYRVWARAHTPSFDEIKLRLAWALGSTTAGGVDQINPSWTYPSGDAFYIADLGEVSIPRARFGSQLWRAKIEAKAATAGQVARVDRLWFQPLDESAGRVVGDADTSGYILRANGTSEVRTEGAFIGATGGSARPVPVIGDLPRVPCAGLEGRTLQVFVKVSRGDLDQNVDAGIDDIQVQLYYRPCWLYLPDDLGS